jgi:hypothetical protein
MEPAIVTNVVYYPLVEKRIQSTVEGLGSFFINLIQNMSSENVRVGVNFLSSMKVESNL